MNILHINGGDIYGGAAKGALLLHHKLLKHGIDSFMLLQKGHDSKATQTSALIPMLSGDAKTLHSKHRDIEAKLVRQCKKKDNFFSAGLCGNDITSLDLYRNADIIHLHWINGGMLSLRSIEKIDKPIVWTIRDMWPFTAGSHYSLGCQEYAVGCTDCFMVDNRLSEHLFKRKMSLHGKKNIHYVAISSWLKERIEESLMLKNAKTSVISNFIDGKAFFPLEKNTAKELLGLEAQKSILLIGAHSLHADYKGFFDAMDIFRMLKKDVVLMVFGHLDRSVLESLGVEYRYFGYVYDDALLRLIYSAADVFLFTSTQEAFGKTVLESIMCETPVVCYNSGGHTDIVIHKKNGYIAKADDRQDYRSGIDWVLEHKDILVDIRKTVESRFKPDALALKYEAIYSKLLENI
eukprot:TRINITY_DN9744_c0_g3_i1.p1 TRINITY_DN9744_c0_g3~~TRINITY_DN9744_c0_g3_i1.p1  ORF type:complete len:406 (+),score=12.83 TRINITY_DN9744_c0_g3_i1:472-1689(+)